MPAAVEVSSQQGGSHQRSPVVLHGANERNLDDGDGDQRQRVVDDAERHSEVVQGAAAEHLRAGLEPGAALDAGAVGL